MTKLPLSRRSTAAKIVIDAYAWIEFFLGNKKGCKVKEILEDAEEIYTPSTVIAEIARKYFREGIDLETIDSRLESISVSSNVTQIDSKTAIEAAKCYIELSENAKKHKLKSPSLFDAIVLATGRVTESKILTGDEHFRDLPEVVWLA